MSIASPTPESTLPKPLQNVYVFAQSPSTDNPNRMWLMMSNTLTNPQLPTLRIRTAICKQPQLPYASLAVHATLI